MSDAKKVIDEYTPFSDLPQYLTAEEARRVLRLGRNAFYDIHRLAEGSQDWFSLTLKASETGKTGARGYRLGYWWLGLPR